MRGKLEAGGLSREENVVDALGKVFDARGEGFLALLMLGWTFDDRRCDVTAAISEGNVLLVLPLLIL